MTLAWLLLPNCCCNDHPRTLAVFTNLLTCAQNRLSELRTVDNKEGQIRPNFRKLAFFQNLQSVRPRLHAPHLRWAGVRRPQSCGRCKAVVTSRAPVNSTSPPSTSRCIALSLSYFRGFFFCTCSLRIHLKNTLEALARNHFFSLS